MMGAEPTSIARRKGGRPPKNGIRAMTPTERSKASREMDAALVADDKGIKRASNRGVSDAVRKALVRNDGDQVNRLAREMLRRVRKPRVA